MTFIILFSIIGGLWGFLTLVGYSFTDAKCSACNMYGEKTYMIEIAPKDYRHYSCRFSSVYSKKTRLSHGSE
jgi:hypothetical protein